MYNESAPRFFSERTKQLSVIGTIFTRPSLPCSLRTVKFLIQDWVVRQTTNTKGKECGSVLSSRLWVGVLRDEIKNGCVADYARPALYEFQESNRSFNLILQSK